VSFAQRRASAEIGVSRRDVLPAGATRLAVQPQPAPKMTGPDWSAFAGVADGDNPYDVGLAAGVSGLWSRSDWPVAVRGDAYFAHHSGDVGTQFGGFDVSTNIFGVLGNAQYSFPTSNKLKPYVFGGLGLFYRSVNVDFTGQIDSDDYNSSTDLGLGIGGGAYLTPKFGLELRFMSVGSFNTIPILAVWHF
jgi:opacity protein-like surface antigen